MYTYKRGVGWIYQDHVCKAHAIFKHENKQLLLELVDYQVDETAVAGSEPDYCDTGIWIKRAQHYNVQKLVEGFNLPMNYKPHMKFTWAKFTVQRLEICGR